VYLKIPAEDILADVEIRSSVIAGKRMVKASAAEKPDWMWEV
jgi:hypothetical protein